MTSFATTTNITTTPIMTADEWVLGAKAAAKTVFTQARDARTLPLTGKTATRTAPTAAKPTNNLRGRFAKHALRPANDKKRSGGADSEGIIGSAILEGLFFGAFPLLGMAYHGLNVLDAVDAYDTAREAFRHANRQPKYGRAANMNPIPAPRRRRSVLALLFG